MKLEEMCESLDGEWNDNACEFGDGYTPPQRPGRGTKIAIPADRFGTFANGHVIFYTDTDEARDIIRGASRGVAREELRGELQREPHREEVESRQHQILNGMRYQS